MLYYIHIILILSYILNNYDITIFNSYRIILNFEDIL